jgi:hypothetical protein
VEKQREIEILFICIVQNNEEHEKHKKSSYGLNFFKKKSKIYQTIGPWFRISMHEEQDLGL